MTDTTNNTILKNSDFTPRITGNDWNNASQSFRCHLIVTKDGDELFSAVALNLPGAGSCGESEEEAIENAKEAIRDTIESYFESGEPIPWKDTSSANVAVGEKHVRIFVNV